ncbi:Phospholipase/carboxylesterase family protein [Candidatus Protochlamydia naegleriophila]|uniref:Phospholipase/carboxylesterase family protein n=1 Tax=Candidatus Protochlamydia naegleriophila TaxID=389348 RepID=A0A0U5JE64_9BACT|nr:dienelactone hydrolase family protein [Candidatus Protochlamydia naegleriophila]CUI17405.1 Phospholipase/carboxylesterase family protein [Candidatus Protochlamydia naegleriophila]
MIANDEVLHRGALITQASKALILLHGRGGTAHGIMGLADSFSTPQLYIAAPQASHSTWYPHSFIVEEKLNEPYLSSSIEVVKCLIDTISKHIPPSQTYLMGFSQGACLALEVAARFATRYGGVIAFTGGLIGSVIDEKKYRGDFKGTPIFIGTSDQDPHVPLERAQESKTLLEKLGAQVTLKVYPGMGHTINEDEIGWVRQNIFLM